MPRFSRTFRIAAQNILLAACFALAACGEAPPPAPPVWQPLPMTALPGWENDAVQDGLAAFRQSCQRLLTLPAERPLHPEADFGTAGEWQVPCRAALLLAADDAPAARRFFESEFQAFGLAKDGLFTGYYEPILKGRRVADTEYRYPVYRLPEDIVSLELGEFREEWKGTTLLGRIEGRRFRPYFDRAAIDAGALSRRGLELLWFDDPIAVFFLHIQGSGVVELPGGEKTRLGYAGKNGRPYYAIGRKLIEMGVIPKEGMSLAAISDWLRQNPDQQTAILNLNQSYVFFEESQREAAIGAGNVPLTAGRSLAVDPAFIPLHAPIWLDAEAPPDPMAAGRPIAHAASARLQRLMIAQDTGGAIKGEVRGDVFFGTGEAAGELAGVMKQPGRYYLLLPKPVAARRWQAASLAQGAP